MRRYDLPCSIQRHYRPFALDAATTSSVRFVSFLPRLGRTRSASDALRAVDNQIYVSMCSPSRNSEASYKAWGHSMVVNPLGEVLCEADENEAILYADIGECSYGCCSGSFDHIGQRI